jgi:hypothetical protein
MTIPVNEKKRRKKKMEKKGLAFSFNNLTKKLKKEK